MGNQAIKLAMCVVVIVFLREGVAREGVALVHDGDSGGVGVALVHVGVALVDGDPGGVALVHGDSDSSAGVARRELQTESEPWSGGCPASLPWHRFESSCFVVPRVANGNSAARFVSWQDGDNYCRSIGGKLAEPIHFSSDAVIHNLCNASGAKLGCWIGLVQSLLTGKTCSPNENPPSLGDWAFASTCKRPLSVMWTGGKTPNDRIRLCARVGDPVDEYDKNTEVVRDTQCDAGDVSAVCEMPATPAFDPNEALCGEGLPYAREKCYELLYAWQGAPFDEALSRATFFTGTRLPERVNAKDVKVMRAMLGGVLAKRAVWLGARWLDAQWTWASANMPITAAEVKTMGQGVLPPGGANQCLIMWPNGTLGQRHCGGVTEYFRVWSAVGLDCGKLVADMSCDCGEVGMLAGGTGGCVPAPAGLRYSITGQALGVASCLGTGAVATADRRALYKKHLYCLSGERALGAGNLAEPQRVLDAIAKLTSLGLATTFSSSEWPESTWEAAQNMGNLYKRFIAEESKFCLTACGCGKVPERGGSSIKCVIPVVEGWVSMSATDLARLQVMCEASPVRGVAQGVFAAHALGCMSTLAEDNRTKALVSDIGAAASISLSKSFAGEPTELLISVLGQVRSAALGGDGAGLMTFGSVPWLAAAFWTGADFTTLSKRLVSFINKLKAIRQSETETAFNANLQGVLKNQHALAESLSSASKDVVNTVDAQLASAALAALETATRANSALGMLQKALVSAQGSDGKGGSLGRVGSAMEQFIKAETNVAKKELDVARRMAIFNFVTSALSLIGTCVTFGAASALKAGVITAKTAARMNKAAELASQGSDLAGRSTDTLFPGGKVAGPLETTFRDLGGLLSTAAQDVLDATPAGDVLAIADSISVFANYNAKLAAIEQDAQAKGAQATAGIAEIRSLLGGLSGKAAALSLTMFSAAVWANSDFVDVTDTRVQPELLEATGLWQAVVQRIITLLISDFKLCPAVEQQNPYRSAISRLPGPSSSNSTSTNSSTNSSTNVQRGGRLLTLRLAPQSPATFGRALGDKDSGAERQAAAQAWDSLARECSGFLDDLQLVAQWGAETQSNVLATINAVRLLIITKVSARAAISAAVSFEKLLLASPTVDTPVPADILGVACAQAATRALLYVGAAGMLGIARALVSDLCVSLAYSNPGGGQEKFITNFSQPFKVDQRCFVTFSSYQGKGNDVVDPVAALDLLTGNTSSGFFSDSDSSPLYTFRKSVVTNLATLYASGSQSSQRYHVKSCAIPQTGIIKSLVQGGRAVIDVTPESFAADNSLTNSDCLINAEVRNVMMVFRAADGAILPRTGSSSIVTATAISSDSSSFFKYTEDIVKKGWLVEHAYTSTLRRRIGFSYAATNTEGNCRAGYDKVTLGQESDGGSFCRSHQDQSDYENALERLPVFGRWEFELGSNGWPVGIEEPSSATLMFDLASACPTAPGHKLRWSQNVTRSPGRSVNQTMLGLICGGKDFARFTSVTASPGSSPISSPGSSPGSGSSSGSGSNLGVIAGAISGAVLVIAAATAVIIKRRNSSRSPTEPNLDLKTPAL
jgi:hypothetical protein